MTFFEPISNGDKKKKLKVITRKKIPFVNTPPRESPLFDLLSNGVRVNKSKATTYREDYLNKYGYDPEHQKKIMHFIRIIKEAEKNEEDVFLDESFFPWQSS